MSLSVRRTSLYVQIPSVNARTFSVMEKKIAQTTRMKLGRNLTPITPEPTISDIVEENIIYVNVAE